MNGADDMNKQQERMSAWLDGAMSPDEAAAFELEMEGNPELASRVERWKGNDARLRVAFEVPEAGAISEELLGRLGLVDEQPTHNVITLNDFRARRKPALNDNATPSKWRWPLAASIAASLIAALAVSTFLMQQPSGIDGQPTFQVAMNSTNSGVAVALGDTRKLTPVLSFEAGDGRFCREFTIEGGASSHQGIACKSAGQWKVEALVKGGGALPTNDEIQTATGKDTASLDAAYSRLRAGDPMDAEKEKAFISNGWKTN
jgi:negative regulator of sigma E activity